MKILKALKKPFAFVVMAIAFAVLTFISMFLLVGAFHCVNTILSHGTPNTFERIGLILSCLTGSLFGLNWCLDSDFNDKDE